MQFDSILGSGIGLLFGLLLAGYRQQTGRWLPSPDAFAQFMEARFPTRTGKTMVVVLLYLGLHLAIGQRPALTDLDHFAFWMTVVMVLMVIVDPWIDPPLRRWGIRK
jgi:hypothetical protein